MKTKKLGIIGCGTIGTEIALAADNGGIDMELFGCCDTDKAKFDSMAAKLTKAKPLFLRAEELIRDSDLVVECAAKAGVKAILETAIKYKRDVMFLSVGGILENMALVEEAKKNMVNIYIPSGAVVGIDGLNAARYKGLKKVTLTTRKPANAFKGNKYLEEKKIDLDNIKSELVIFEGNAYEAVKAFPANVNVAATISLAGLGPEKTVIKVVIDPSLKVNTHEIVAEGDFGVFRAKSENLPSPNNPKTSYITSLSAIATIKKIVEPFHIGS